MAGRARTTIADVAKAAGVSETTVSHALNGKGRVDAATRARVRQAAADLRYSPSRAARQLATGSSGVLGLALPAIARLPLRELMDTDWYTYMAVTASQAAFDRGCALTLLPPSVEETKLRRLGLDGVLVLDPAPGDRRIDVFTELAIPVVALGLDPEHPEVRTVAPDTRQGITDLLDHLRDQGAHTIDILATDIRWQSETIAIATAEDWAGTTACRIDVHTVELSRHTSREGIVAATRRAATRALEADPPPDAMIGLFEDFGLGILDAAHDLNLEVPRDLLVAQDFDGFKARHARPALTAIDLHPDTQMPAAVDQLLSNSTEPTITTPATVRIRQSTTRRTPDQSDADLVAVPRPGM
ncbi:LacI family DNA-binding transcriptional regulator [Nocardia sp. NPDC058176]|uniref:LacI family DNA-binding transcriptional regulator n=1 Tax=Nocardia sp. NPDC058176 TaxID=3346368 RepID=UPI0036DED942